MAQQVKTRTAKPGVLGSIPGILMVAGKNGLLQVVLCYPHVCHGKSECVHTRAYTHVIKKSSKIM